jgi:hypothetical protein
VNTKSFTKVSALWLNRTVVPVTLAVPAMSAMNGAPPVIEAGTVRVPMVALDALIVMAREPPAAKTSRIDWPVGVTCNVVARHDPANDDEAVVVSEQDSTEVRIQTASISSRRDIIAPPPRGCASTKDYTLRELNVWVSQAERAVSSVAPCSRHWSGSKLPHR